MTAPTAEQVAARLTPVVLRVARRIRPSSGDLSAGHFSLLATLRRHGPQRPSDLARIEHISPPAAARAIAALEERGLVLRRPSASDARSSTVEITTDGTLLLTDARERQAEIVASLLTGLSPDDLALIGGALDPLEALVVTVPESEYATSVRA